LVEPSERLHALGLTLLGAGEEQAEQVLGGGLVWRRQRVHVLAPAVQVRATLRCCAREDEATDESRAQEHELLGDVAAEREPQQIDLLQAEGVDERERVASHGGDVLWDDAR
jgi:hypothetical protein